MSGVPALLYNLHLLRVIAALSVVYFHTTSVADPFTWYLISPHASKVDPVIDRSALP
jgi:peptidoglycan/LPS O-acetylase OafA/YrhL